MAGIRHLPGSTCWSAGGRYDRRSKVGTARIEFAWQDDGLFLRQRSDTEPMPASAPQAWRENAPSSTSAVIGLDDASKEWTTSRGFEHR